MKIPGQPQDRKRKREKAPEGVILPIRVLLRGCMVIAERTSPDNDAVDLVIANPASGTEYVLEMDSEQNVALAELLLKGKPQSVFAMLSKTLSSIDVVGADELPDGGGVT